MRFRVALAATALACLAACGGDPAPPDTLRRGLSADPATLDPQQARSVAALKVLGDVYEGLLAWDAEGRLAPGVSDSWQVTPEGTRYTFSLRDGARWHDGQPVTAADFVHAWRHLADPNSGAFYADLLLPVVGARAIAAGEANVDALAVKAVAPDVLEVTLERPLADFLPRLAHPAFAPRREDKAPPFGNGPYRVAARETGRIALERSASFHAADAVRIPRVDYVAFEQEASEYSAFRAGELDVTSRVPREVFRLAPAERGPVRVAPYLGTVYLAFNMREPPPLTLRRALSLAVDREALARTVLGRGETPASGLVPPGAANGATVYRTLAEMNAPEPYELRVERARELAGDTPHSLTLAYASSDENRVVAAALQAMWREALPQVEVRLENREFRVMLSEMRAGRFEGLVRASWIADYDDAAQFLEILTSGHPANNAGFADTRFDTLMASAAHTESVEGRALALRAAESMLHSQVPVIPLYHFVSKHLVAERVRGWRDNALDLHYSRYLSLAGTGDEGQR